MWHSTYTTDLFTSRRKGDVCIWSVPISKGCTSMNKKMSLLYYPGVPAVIIYLWNIDVSSMKPCLVNLCLVPVNQNNIYTCWMGHIKLLTTWSITFLWTFWFFVVSRMTTNTYMKERLSCVVNWYWFYHLCPLYVLDELFMTFVHEMTQKKFPWYRYTKN